MPHSLPELTSVEKPSFSPRRLLESGTRQCEKLETRKRFTNCTNPYPCSSLSPFLFNFTQRFGHGFHLACRLLHLWSRDKTLSPEMKPKGDRSMAENRL